MTNVKKNDFIEIEFTGTVNDQIFDTTNPKEAEQMGVDPKGIKPHVVSAGNEMLLKGLDEALEGKEFRKSYSVHLTPDKAFGHRNPKLIRTVPKTSFKEKNIDPQPGMVIQQMDNSLARIISVSGGRVMIDSNNPLAGKEVDYKFKITKKITDEKEKVNALQDFFFKQRFEFIITNKKVIFKDSKLKPLFDAMGEKFKEIIGLEFGVEEKKQEKKQKKKKKKKKQEKKSESKEKRS